MKNEKSRSKKKNIIMMLVPCLMMLIIALVVLGYFFFSNTDMSEELETYTVSYGNITYSVSGDGTVQQANISTISPDISARIIEANYQQGDSVTEGDVIYKFDTSAIDSEIEEAQLAYDKAKITYENSWDTEKKINEIEMKTAELKLKTSKEKLNNYEVVAPISGVIIKAEYSTGDYYDGNSGKELVVIADQNSFEVNFDIDESYINQISRGQTASIQIKAASPQHYIGIVDDYNLMGTTGNGVTTYSVCVVFDIPEYAKILNGMNANVSVVLQQKENVLIIPSSAIDKDGNVTIKTSNTEYQTVSVGLGICDDEYVEILSGLQEGDIILRNP